MTTAKYRQKQRDGRKFHESRDCAVIAIALVCDSSYEAALALTKKFGRKSNAGLGSTAIIAAIKETGAHLTKVDPGRIISKYPGVHSNLKHITSRHPSRFHEVWKNGKTYIAFVRKHCFAIIDGENHDWSANRSKHVEELYEIKR